MMSSALGGHLYDPCVTFAKGKVIAGLRASVQVKAAQKWQ